VKNRTLFFVLKASRDQDLGLEDYITGQLSLKQHGKDCVRTPSIDSVGKFDAGDV